MYLYFEIPSLRITLCTYFLNLYLRKCICIRKNLSNKLKILLEIQRTKPEKDDAGLTWPGKGNGNTSHCNTANKGHSQECQDKKSLYCKLPTQLTGEDKNPGKNSGNTPYHNAAHKRHSQSLFCKSL